MIEKNNNAPEQKKETVNHPSHYQSESGIEVIEVIRAFTADLNGAEAFDIGNVLKYVMRYKKKNGLEDLKKAAWYLNDAIKMIENSTSSSFVK